MYFQVFCLLFSLVLVHRSLGTVTCPSMADGTPPGVLAHFSRYKTNLVKKGTMRAILAGTGLSKDDCVARCVSRRDEEDHGINAVTYEAASSYGMKSVCYCTKEMAAQDIINDGPRFQTCFLEDMGIHGNCPEGALWTPWHDRDDADGIGDVETRAFYRPRGTCASGKASPLALQARVVGTQLPHTQTGDRLMINLRVGLVCFNKRQKDNKPCQDYEVRYCCKR